MHVWSRDASVLDMLLFHLLKLRQPDKVFFHIFREVISLYRLFLVDDEYGQLELMRRILLKMKEDLEIECFTRPQDALSAMQIAPARIIISDIRMPQMDGLSFIRQIRQEYPDTVIAILSAYGDFSYARQAMAYSVADYLVKPVNRRELQKLMDDIYARLRPKEFPHIPPKEYEHLERSLISAVCQGKEELAAEAMEQFLKQSRKQKLSGSPTAAIQNFSHIMFVLHRQLGIEIPDAVFRDLDSCHSLQELCALIQDCITKNLKKRLALNEQGTACIIEEITHYIEENLEKDLSLHAIAQQFHFNPSYLSSLFKRQTGRGLKEYMIQRRIERAKGLLTDSDLKVQQIASRCGYEDDSYFVQLFKRQTGLSPSQYRRKIRLPND